LKLDGMLPPSSCSPAMPRTRWTSASCCLSCLFSVGIEIGTRVHIYKRAQKSLDRLRLGRTSPLLRYPFAAFTFARREISRLQEVCGSLSKFLHYVKNGRSRKSSGHFAEWPQFCDHSVTSTDVRLSVGFEYAGRGSFIVERFSPG